MFVIFRWQLAEMWVCARTGCWGGLAAGHRHFTFPFLKLFLTITLQQYFPAEWHMQWSVLPHASCCHLHLDFFFFAISINSSHGLGASQPLEHNCRDPPIPACPRTLNTDKTDHEKIKWKGKHTERYLQINQEQSWRPLHFHFSSIYSAPTFWMGRQVGCRGKGQEAALICGCDHSAGQGRQGQGCFVRSTLGGDVDCSTVSP